MYALTGVFRLGQLLFNKDDLYASPADFFISPCGCFILGRVSRSTLDLLHGFTGACIAHLPPPPGACNPDTYIRAVTWNSADISQVLVTYYSAAERLMAHF